VCSSDFCDTQNAYCVVAAGQVHYMASGTDTTCHGQPYAISCRDHAGVSNDRVREEVNEDQHV
jgi:hypothetical protein